MIYYNEDLLSDLIESDELFEYLGPKRAQMSFTET